MQHASSIIIRYIYYLIIYTLIYNLDLIKSNSLFILSFYQ